MDKEQYQPKQPEGTELVRCLPELPLDKFFQFLDPGAIVDFSLADGFTKKAVRSYFDGMRPVRKWQLGYSIVFMKDYSEIQLKCKDPSKSFTWKFMNKDLFDATEKNANRDSKLHTYGVRKRNNAERAVQQLRRIRDIFPALVDKLAVYSGALINEKIAKEIAKITKVKVLFIEGKDVEVSKTFDILLKHITVLDRLDVYDCAGKKALNPSKIAEIPYARLTLQSAPAPERLFETACEKKNFLIAKGPKSLCNSLIRCWLTSDSCDLNVLTVEIAKFTNDNNRKPLDGMFDGLNFVKGTRVCTHSDREKPITEWGCFLVLLQHEGIEFRRRDGATLCLFYTSYLKGGNFTLIAEYPGRSLRTAKINAYCDQYAELFARPEMIEEYNLRQLRNRRVAAWVDANRGELDAAELARHRRFQAADAFKDALEFSKYQLSGVEASDLKQEIASVFQAEGRKAYGYFELAEQSVSLKSPSFPLSA